MGRSMFDDIVEGAIVAKHVFRGASKAYAKAKQVAESEKGQQIRKELREKTNEAIGIASDKAREMGLEEKTRGVLELAKEYAKEMILNTSGSLEPDITLAQIVPGSYAERINDLEKRIMDEAEKHNQILAAIPATDDDYEQKIRDEEERFADLYYNLQEELSQLKYEEQDMILTIAEQKRVEEMEEEKRRREENERDWAILMGKDPDRY